jgi:hypothetical protein
VMELALVWPPLHSVSTTVVLCCRVQGSRTQRLAVAYGAIMP